MAIRGKSIWIHDISEELAGALALELSQMGNHVLVSGRDEVAMRRLAELSGGAISGFALDLQDRESRERATAGLSVLTDTLDIAICHNNPENPGAVPGLQGRVMEQLTSGLFFDAVRFVEIATPLLQLSAKPQLLIINTLDKAMPYRRDLYRAPDAALESFTRALARDESYRKFSVNLALVDKAASPVTAAGNASLSLPRQIIAAMGQAQMPIRIPPRQNRLRQFLAWRPRGWYRSGIGLASAQKGNMQ